MEHLFEKAEQLAAAARAYADARLEEARLTAAEKISAVLSNLLAGLIVAAVLFLFVVFGSLALAMGIGIWTGKPWLGFLVVALFYLLIAVFAWLARERWLRIPMMNAIIRQLFNRSNGEDEED